MICDNYCNGTNTKQTYKQRNFILSPVEYSGLV